MEEKNTENMSGQIPDILQDNLKFAELMKKIESENAGQEKYAKKQYTMAKISAVSSVLVLAIVLACVLMLVPRALNTFDQLDTIMYDLETVTEEVSESLPQMIENADSLMTTADEGIADALVKITELDIQSLNDAIQDLRAVVEPLAKMLGRR